MTQTAMTLEQLYQQTTGWTARHIVQDELLSFGRNAIASEYIINRVAALEAKESRASAASITDRG